MALPSLSTMTDDLVDAMVEELEATFDDDFDEPVARESLEPMARGIASWLTDLVENHIKVKPGISVDSGTFETDEEGDLE